MAAEPIERLNYFQFQYLGAEDLIAQQAYHRDMRRRHNLGPHTTGIITGLSLVERAREGDAPFVDVYVLPGICVDGYGRDIIVLEPVRIDGELFAAYNTDRHLELWIAYDELAAQTATGGFAPCADAESYARVRETYRFAIGTIDPSHDEIVVAGRNAVPAAVGADDTVIPADESIAFQDFPDNERQARWLVRLGMCHWDGTVRKFRQAAAGMLSEGRHYAGFVGAALLSESGALRIAPRTAAADVDLADFATVDGRLQVNGRIVAKKDVFLHGGKLSLQSAGGSDETVPLWLQRLSNPVGSGSDLRIHIGDTPAKNARLTIGPGPAATSIATEKVVLGVRGDDKVDIPTGRLRFGAQTRQHIDLWGTDDNAVAPYGIGVQGGATYFRTGGDFYWHLNGEHSDANGDPGAGGARLMRLSGQGSLHFSNDFRQFLNVVANGQTFGMGVQDLTLYQRSWSDFAWYRGGSHGMGHFDSGGGALAMWLDGASRLSVMGGVTSRSTVSLWGGKLEFLTGAGGTDTDPLEVMRITNAPNRNDLRIVIGDDDVGDDRLTVGPVTGAGFLEKFVVQNNGDVRIAGDLYVRGSKVPPAIDVVTGKYFLNRISNGTETVQLSVSTGRLASISDAHITVALSDIGNQHAANDARWAVSWDNTRILAGSTAIFPIRCEVGDSDGNLFFFSFVAVFYG
jgi:hypothetical protein